jgi:hypothetical protein
MRHKNHKSKAFIEYKSSVWRTKIKGDLSNPIVKNLIIADIIQKWLIRFALITLTVLEIKSQIAP